MSSRNVIVARERGFLWRVLLEPHLNYPFPARRQQPNTIAVNTIALSPGARAVLALLA